MRIERSSSWTVSIPPLSAAPIARTRAGSKDPSAPQARGDWAGEGDRLAGSASGTVREHPTGGRAAGKGRHRQTPIAVNLIEDLLERFPASKPALLAIDADGDPRVWHFGELIAMSAGLSGAFAARGVGRGDLVMTLVGNRIEWVLSLLACWRMGAVALPCNTQLRRPTSRPAPPWRTPSSASATRSCSASCRTGSTT